MRFIDNHCHLFHEYFPSYDDYINKANNVNVTKIIVSGTDKKSNQEVLSLISKYEGVYGSIGFHPNELEDLDETSFALLESQLKTNKKIVGIGEIGLDYHYPDTNKEKQKKFFIYQLELANKYNLPVVIHSRDATSDTISLLREHLPNKRGVIHCFSGSLESANEYIKMGFFIGVGGVSTFKNANNIINVIKNISLHKILLETDAPYLTPEPYRGTPNYSAYIPIIADKIASIKGLSLEEVAEITTANSESLFDF